MPTVRETEDEWYVTFISIVFGVFISPWIEPLASLIQMYSSLEEVLFTFVIARGLLMLLILICLWWWYAMFLGKVEPAKGFVMYFYDFLSLGAFAVAARFWHRSLLFPTTVLYASALMLYRFWRARRWLSPHSNERKALHNALVVLVFTIVFLTGFFAAGLLVEKPEKVKVWRMLDGVVIVLMLAGVGATCIAVRQTEGLIWPRHLPRSGELTDKLTLILPDAPQVCDLGKLRESIILAREDFENGLRASDLSGGRSPHLSEVHTYKDVEVQAFLLCLPSIGQPDELRTKSFLTFFGHWLDDISDRGLLPMVQSIIQNERRAPVVDEVVRQHSDRKLSSFVQQVLARLGRHPFLEVGFSRLLLGSFIFAKDPVARLARQVHDELLDRYLQDHAHNRGEFDKLFVELTTKTVQELWLGLEQPPPTFYLTFLYSLLYAPALYYHDYREEVEVGELAGSWGTVNPSDAVKHVLKVGDYLAKLHDPRVPLRAWQIRAVSLSFIDVLPKEVQKGYEEVAKRLTLIDPQRRLSSRVES